MEYKTIEINFDENMKTCFLRFNRPDQNNTINSQLVLECLEVINEVENKINVLVLEGNDDVFCFGADFKNDYACSTSNTESNPGMLYDLWKKISNGNFISISHIKGRVNAGGMGFVAASDAVISGKKATFSLSEMLFGLYPAMVMPFLIRKIGVHKAKYLTMLTKPIDAEEAKCIGLVDALGEKSERLLKQHIIRFSQLPKEGIVELKKYINNLDNSIEIMRNTAIQANLDIFSNENNRKRISRFVNEGKYPWE